MRGRGTYSMMDAFFQTGSNVHHEVWGGIKRFIKKKKEDINNVHPKKHSSSKHNTKQHTSDRTHLFTSMNLPETGSASPITQNGSLRPFGSMLFRAFPASTLTVVVVVVVVIELVINQLPTNTKYQASLACVLAIM